MLGVHAGAVPAGVVLAAGGGGPASRPEEEAPGHHSCPQSHPQCLTPTFPLAPFLPGPRQNRWTVSFTKTEMLTPSNPLTHKGK